MKEYQQQYGGLGLGLGRGQQGIGRVSSGSSSGGAGSSSGGSGAGAGTSTGGNLSTNPPTTLGHPRRPGEHITASSDRGATSSSLTPRPHTTLKTTKSPNILRELRKTSATLLHTFASETLTATR